MKKLLLLITILLTAACSKDERNLETFSPEAFAYDLGDKWEVNAMVNVRGFEQKERDDSKSFEASIIVAADVKPPKGSIISGVFTDTVNISRHEEILDIPIDVQFELDSTYILGRYQIAIHITDDFSKKDITTTVEFELAD